MKITVKKMNNISGDLGLSGIRFDFTLEDDDINESLSTNVGGGKIQLMSNFCHFYFPIDIELPHPDLCAFSALKIMSPYIGSTFNMDRGVSPEFSRAIKNEYPKIQKINTDHNLSSLAPKKTIGSAISFSGGVDSIAASVLIGDNAPLIMTARTFHPDIGEFEKWNNPNAQIKTLNYMPFNFKKILVYTDFPYLSSNGRFCIYPDTYVFTLPAVLLSESIGFKHIITGDILAAFTENETMYSSILDSEAKTFFSSIGINLDYPCNGISEIITTRITKDAGLLDISSACEFGDFKKPCMKCLKCFRKSIYRWALFDDKLTQKELEQFNQSPAITKFATGFEQHCYSFMASFKYCFSRINYNFAGNIKIIRDRAMRYKDPINWVDRRVVSAYKSREDIINNTIPEIRKYAADMQEWDFSGFKLLNWRDNYN
jgi:hypothetical protein